MPIVEDIGTLSSIPEHSTAIDSVDATIPLPQEDNLGEDAGLNVSEPAGIDASILYDEHFRASPLIPPTQAASANDNDTSFSSHSSCSTLSTTGSSTSTGG